MSTKRRKNGKLVRCTLPNIIDEHSNGENEAVSKFARRAMVFSVVAYVVHRLVFFLGDLLELLGPSRHSRLSFSVPSSGAALLSDDIRLMPFNYPLFEFGATFEVSLPSGISLPVASGSCAWHWGNFTKHARLLKINSLISAEDATAIISRLPDNFSTAPDSVDQLPSYEFYLQHPRGISKAAPVEQSLAAISSNLIESRILPFVRKQYNCSSCRVCTSLVRRYQANQRLRHPPHFDTQALITVVVHITTHGEHFRGGLYVRTSPGTEEFVHAVAGDAIVHQHDLEHGVWVREGNRISWILWVQDALQCEGPLSSWHRNGASRGDPIAQYHMSTLYERGRGGVSKNGQKAAALLHRASLQGYSRAQHKLGNMFFSGIGVEENMTTALKLYVSAAEQNSSFAAYSAGRMFQAGFGSAKDDAAAAWWYEKAAGDTFEHFPDAADRLAKMLFNGAVGIQKDQQAAVRLWHQAASQGRATAASSLAHCYENGVGVEANGAEARRWHARAAKINSEKGSE